MALPFKYENQLILSLLLLMWAIKFTPAIYKTIYVCLCPYLSQQQRLSQIQKTRAIALYVIYLGKVV